MKARPIKISPDGGYMDCSVSEATHVQLMFPLEWRHLQRRIIPIQLSGTRANTGNWTWNGDTEKPTLKPSILTTTEWGPEHTKHACHSFVNDGMVQFLSDCTHENAGKTIELMEIEQ